jgi:malic enzyme
MTAVEEVFPHCCVQFEDWAGTDAVRLLARYKARFSCFNDDIQGTAAVAVAGVFAALRITGRKLAEQSFLFLGAGSAGLGIAELLVYALRTAGLSEAQARSRIWLFDVNGLIESTRGDLLEFQKPYAQVHPPTRDFLGAVESIKPTAIVGVSTVSKAFDQPIIEAMARLNQAAPNLPVFESHFAFGVHRRRGVPVVRRARGIRERKPVPTGTLRREDLGARAGKQRFRFSGNRDGGVCDQGEACDR